MPKIAPKKARKMPMRINWLACGFVLIDLNYVYLSSLSLDKLGAFVHELAYLGEKNAQNRFSLDVWEFLREPIEILH